MSTLQIIHTADSHGTSAVYEQVGGSINRETLLLDAGDAIVGSNTAFRWHEPNLLTMSELGYHAMTMGNRELHYVPAVMERRASERSFPLLAANLEELWGRSKSWEEGLSLEMAGLKVGIFGMTVVQYPVGSLYEKLFGLRFLPPETLIEHLVSKYQADNDVVIFLSHLGIEWDRRLAEIIAAKPELKCDLILGGHTHISHSEPEIIGNTKICHVGSHSSGYGHWQFLDGEWAYRLVEAERVLEVS